MHLHRHTPTLHRWWFGMRNTVHHKSHSMDDIVFSRTLFISFTVTEWTFWICGTKNKSMKEWAWAKYATRMSVVQQDPAKWCFYAFNLWLFHRRVMDGEFMRKNKKRKTQNIKTKINYFLISVFILILSLSAQLPLVQIIYHLQSIDFQLAENEKSPIKNWFIFD